MTIPNLSKEIWTKLKEYRFINDSEFPGIRADIFMLLPRINCSAMANT